jgi:outer membrane protein assembly factor BamE (lipoprotein component of BamABCDE complex)
MQLKPYVFALAAAVATVGLAGCSTVDSRIQQNPGLFASLSPAQQALVKQGKVGVGMDEPTVRLALGDPDRVTIRTSAQGEMRVWHYVTYENNGVILYSGYYHRWWGLNGWGDYPYYMDYPARRPHDYFRVEFQNGRVVAIEQETP